VLHSVDGKAVLTDSRDFLTARKQAETEMLVLKGPEIAFDNREVALESSIRWCLPMRPRSIRHHDRNIRSWCSL